MNLFVLCLMKSEKMPLIKLGVSFREHMLNLIFKNYEFNYEIQIFQVYMYTYTGLQDKKSNHLTQFVGLLLRPKNFCENAITNGH